MLNPEKFGRFLLEQGVNFFTGVPDSLLKDFAFWVDDCVEKEQHIITPNEGNALALAAGHYMATGEISLVYMQNSGLGNAVNPLTSLSDAKVYGIPTLLMIGWRGEPGKPDEPQHIKMGEVNNDFLDALGIRRILLSSNPEESERQVTEAILYAKEKKSPCVLMVQKGTFDKFQHSSKKISCDFEMSRSQALACVLESLNATDCVVSTTGKLSRELYHFREEHNQDHNQELLTVGSMGHASQIALGIALSQKNKRVFCLDGDGSVLMHMGSLATVGSIKPKNYYHIVFNNGSHDSVGGQKTVALDISLSGVAEACGYEAKCVTSKKDLLEVLQNLNNQEKPIFLEIKINNAQKVGELPRPKEKPQSYLMDFMCHIQKGI